MQTIEDILVATKQTDRIWRGDRALSLWRALHLQDDRPNPLYPDLRPRKLPNGKIRLPDINIYPVGEIYYVKSELEHGTSLVNKHGIFGSDFSYHLIPAGTLVPRELIITKDHRMPKYGCWHYSILPNFDMPEAELLKALDRLAQNAGINLLQKYA